MKSPISKSTKYGLVAVLTLALSACSGGGTTNSSSSESDEGGEDATALQNYVAFDPSNFANQLKRVQVYQSFADQRGAPSQALFTDFRTEYAGTGADSSLGEHGLKSKVVGREDDHEFQTRNACETCLNKPDLGAQMDTYINDATDLGEASGDGSNLQKDQGQIVDKTLLRFFYLSVYHEMFKGIAKTRELFEAGQTTEGNETKDGPKNWDEAFGYFGIAENRTDFCRGICATITKRETTYPTTFGGMKDDIVTALIRGKEALEEGDFETAEAQRDLVDEKMLFLFAVSLAKEFQGYLDATSDNTRVTKLIEARIFVDILEPYIRNRNADENYFGAATVGEGNAADADAIRNVVNTYDLPGALRNAVDGGDTSGLPSNATVEAARDAVEKHFGFTLSSLN